MKHFSLLTLALLVTTLVVSPVLAQPDRQAATVSVSGATIIVPPQAVAGSPTVVPLGSAIDPQSGKVVTGYAIIHYKNNPAKPPQAGSGKKTACYGFLAKDARWKSVEPWLVNAANDDGLSESFVVATFSNAIGKWEDAADGAINGSSIDILGNGSATSSPLVAGLDGLNGVYFGSLSNSNTIAVTMIWGTFGGPLAGRQLVEWDQVYNDPDNLWGDATGNPAAMDLDNIGTHELGHSVGLDDLYQADCSSQTMYGYASAGDTNKQTLEPGDILGISTLY